MSKRILALAAALLILVGSVSPLILHFMSSPKAPAVASVVADTNIYREIPAVKVLAQKHQLVNEYYVTRHGDSLTAIAKRHDLSWKGLYCENRKVIGKDPSSLVSGTRLFLGTAHCRIPVIRAPAPVVPVPLPAPAPIAGTYSCSQLEQLWVSAGGPASVEFIAAEIAKAESGGNPNATEPNSGAAGLWQILGQVVPGNIYDPMVNAENAVKKYNDAGGFSPWVTYTQNMYIGLC